eukprot:1179841-Prorocentrum_minimum.AAC.2
MPPLALCTAETAPMRTLGATQWCDAALCAASCIVWIRNCSKEPVRCTRSLLLGILDVHNVGNTAFWNFVPLTYCTTRPEDAPGILHYYSGSGAYGRLDLTDKSPPDPLLMQVSGRTLVFTRTKSNANWAHKELKKNGIAAEVR